MADVEAGHFEEAAQDRARVIEEKMEEGTTHLKSHAFLPCRHTQTVAYLVAKRPDPVFLGIHPVDL